MGRPTRALVLAAGFGTRLLPLTREIPKPLLPIWNRPLLLRILDQLRAWGVREVVVNLHHQPGPILNLLRTQPLPGLHLALSFEPEILGTGGALERAHWFLGRDPFWMINGDVVADLDPRPLVRAFDPRRTIASAWVTKKTGPRSIDIADGRVLSFRAARPGGPGTATFCGVHLVHPRVLEFIPPGFSSIVTAYEKAMAQGWGVAAREVRGSYWADIGTPSAYLRAHRDLAPHKGGRMVCADRSVSVGRGASLDNVVLLPGAVVNAGAALRDCIVAANAPASGRIEGAVVMRAAVAMPHDGLPDGIRRDRAVVHAHPKRGSARSYTRVIDGPRSVMVMHYDPSRDENRLFAGHARWLARRGIRTPHLLREDAGACRIVLEDVGEVSVEHAFPGWSEAARMRWYGRAVALAACLHGIRGFARRTWMPPLDPTRMNLEHDLFMEQFAAEVSDKALQAGAFGDLRRARDLLAVQPRVLIHRDFQSSNLMVRGGELVMLDFQGMRPGPAAYDLASLLWDPYVELTGRQREALLKRYAASAPRPPDDVLRAGVVQRLTQALGAFVRLSRNPGQERFRNYIPAAVRRLTEDPAIAAGYPDLVRLLSKRSPA